MTALATTTTSFTSQLPDNCARLLYELSREFEQHKPQDAVQFAYDWLGDCLRIQRATTFSFPSQDQDSTPASVAGAKAGKASAFSLTRNSGFGEFGVYLPPQPNTGLPQQQNKNISPSSVLKPLPQQSQFPQEPRQSQPAPASMSLFASGYSMSAGSSTSSNGHLSPRHFRNTHPNEDGKIAETGERPVVDAAQVGGGVVDYASGPHSMTHHGYGGSHNHLDIPKDVYLGRRHSVSAESMDPNAPPPVEKIVIPKTADQLRRIQKAISSNLLFKEMSDEQYDDIVNAMQEVKVAAGQPIITQGDQGDHFYVVESGEFDIWKAEPRDSNYVPPPLEVSPRTTAPTPGATFRGIQGPGTSFGELALMYNSPRAASIVAAVDSTVWQLDRITFRYTIMAHTHMRRTRYESFLEKLPLLQKVERYELSKIADALESRIYPEGTNVINQGEVGKEFYIVEAGVAEVVDEKDGSRVKINELSVGDYFGELALLNDNPRAATVTATTKLKVAVLDKEAFTRLLGPAKDLMERHSHSYRDADGRPRTYEPPPRDRALSH
ncbi:camp-binding domain-like protein [Atractiella rhizophila]|nr:camp-binding domain-like protein [Atractiella rhizophila]